jgi:lactoylglutathione lyase
MKTSVILFSSFALILFSLIVCMFASAQDPQPEQSEFLKPTIDLGCVVSDIDASVKFYTEAIGFKVTGGFVVEPDFAAKTGLTDHKKLDVKVLTLGEGEGVTNLKLMQFDGESAKSKNDHINTTLGFSYITVFVSSTDDAMARLTKAGVKPIAEPAVLPDYLDPSMALTIIRDPDGNLIELVGPKPVK